MSHELGRVLAAVLDADWLSEHTGQPVRAARLRVKPETSLTVGLSTRQDGRSVGWMRVLWPINHVKAEVIRRDAEKHGHRVEVQQLDDRLLTVTGPIPVDPKLRRRIRRAIDEALMPGWPPTELLRYNPMRRLVVRDGEKVIRVAARATSEQDAIQELIADLVPCPKRLDDAQLPGCSVIRFTGDGDLVAFPSRAGARLAGEHIARLHAAALPESPLLEQLNGRGLDPAQQGSGHADLLEHLDRDLAASTREVVSRLAAWPTCGGVLSHGDLSPDQVLTTRDGSKVWLTDFDRAQIAPVSADLGSFLAEADPQLGEAFCEGYEAAGGRLPDHVELSHGIAWSLMLRLMDPLRHAAPDWRQQVASQLDRIVEVLP
ncbi:MAG: aminoglycoside phosphotransferase family protein [Propionibacteriaceae bacterium]|nr:aminoglycoside phosphotransferase family protein [Propionibacteriaceae bacterium]